jgi:hypothetical protein
VFVNVAESDPGGLWTSLGMPARAAFVVRISAPFVPEPDTDLAPPAEQISLATGQEMRKPGPAGPLAAAGPKKWVRTPPNGTPTTHTNGDAPLKPAPAKGGN